MWGDLTDRFIKTETESGFEDKEEEKSQEIKTEIKERHKPIRINQEKLIEAEIQRANHRNETGHVEKSSWTRGQEGTEEIQDQTDQETRRQSKDKDT